LTPKNAGEAEEHTIDMSSYSKTETHFLAIRVIDQAGNKGEPSNVISVALVVPTKFSNGDELDDGSSKKIIIGVCVGVGLLIVIVVVVVVAICCCRKKDTPPPPANPPQAQQVVYNVGQGELAPSAPYGYPQADDNNVYDNRGFSNMA
jgi:hypothetical protein